MTTVEARTEDTREARRVGVFEWTKAVRDSDLPPHVKHVLLTLATWMDAGGGSCFPTVETIADGVGKDRSNVLRALRSAADAGWVERRSGTYGRQSNYMATCPKGRAGATLEGEVEDRQLSRSRHGNSRVHATQPDHDQIKKEEGRSLIDALAARIGRDATREDGEKIRHSRSGRLLRIAAEKERAGYTPDDVWSALERNPVTEVRETPVGLAYAVLNRLGQADRARRGGRKSRPSTTPRPHEEWQPTSQVLASGW